jgi:hypothetical protein
MQRLLRITAIIFISVFTFACTNGYVVTFETLQLVLKKIEEDSLAGKRHRYYDIADVIEDNKEYYNRVKTIECIDNDQKPFIMDVTYSTILTVTNKHGAKIKYFLDSIHLRSDSVMVGRIGRQDKYEIPTKLKEIVKTEVWTYNGMN